MMKNGEEEQWKRKRKNDLQRENQMKEIQIGQNE
jgi:hypothetical protein